MSPRPSLKDRANIGAQARAAAPAKQLKSRGGRPPIWPLGTEVERLNLRWPCDAVKRLRQRALDEGRDPSLILYDLVKDTL